MSLETAMQIDTVLSGSSTKYPCHVGFFKGLLELGLETRRLAVNSGGAMIGGFYAAGMPIDEMTDTVLHTDVGKFVRIGLFSSRRLYKKGYLSNGNRFLRFLKRTTKKKRLKDLSIPICIMTSNFASRNLQVLTQETDPDLLLADAIYMSCTMPGLFRPIKYRNCSMRDGSLHRDFPWDIWPDVPRLRVGHLIAFQNKSIMDDDWNGYRELAEYGVNVAHGNVRRSLDCGPQMPHGIVVESHGLCLPALRLSISKEQRIAMVQEGYNNTISKLKDNIHRG